MSAESALKLTIDNRHFSVTELKGLTPGPKSADIFADLGLDADELQQILEQGGFELIQ